MAEQTPNILGNLQQKINDKSFNPQEYDNQQLSLIDSLLEQGVLKGPRIGEIIQEFSETQKTIAKKKNLQKIH